MINPKEFQIPFLIENSFYRKKCKKCGCYFWTLNKERETCGESPCEPYVFLKKSMFNRKCSLNEMRKLFLNFFKKYGHEILSPRPVVARWRDDLYLTIASIALFQPFVTNGITPPPANPLVISQPCIRLVDIDNVGLTMGRHLTIFEMGGHHAFNYPNLKVYWKNETVKYCHEFLTKTLGAPPEEITYKESFWEGGGNAGPSFEVCIGGLEVATLVFMCYKTVNGNYIEMPLKIVDTGYGIERLAWVSTKLPTAFHVIYPGLMEKLLNIIGINISSEFLKEYVYIMSSLKGDYNSIKKIVSQNIGINLNELIKLISPLETLFGILDHTKCLTFMLADGIVPSNTGEGYLARLVLRRTMKLMKLLNIKLPLTEIIDMQIKLWGETFPRLKEMRSIILDMVSIEEERYKRTLAKGSSIIERICKNLTKKSENKLSIDTLIELYDSHGIPPEITQKVASKFGVEVEIPNNFYAIVAAKHQAKTKKIKEEKIPFHIDVTQFPKTKLLYYDDPYKFTFKAKVLGVIDNYIILDKTAFYPEGGGQPSDTGYIIWNSNKASIIDVQKINDVVIHRVDGPLPPIGSIITGIIDEKRRLALMRNHTATHILLAAATKVLGRHIWQAGTQKDVNRSRLDITHYKQLSYDEVRKIELLANNYVMANLKVKTSFMNRTEAEQKFGFRLYQGGVVPGRDIRVVEIGDIDVQACGGTHCKSTGEIGLIKILRAHRIQDGVIRLEFACGEAALIYIQNQEALINKIAKTLNTQISYIPETIEKLKLEVKSLRHKSRILWKHYMSILKEQLIKNQKNIGQFKLITGTLSELSMKDLIDLAAAIIKEVQNSIVSLFNIDGEAVTFVIMAEENAVKLGLNCHTLAKEISQILSGKGGGRNNLAQGSGKNASKIKDAVNLIEQFLSSITK